MYQLFEILQYCLDLGNYPFNTSGCISPWQAVLQISEQDSFMAALDL